MENLLGILLVAIIAFLFWQQRRQTELAQYFIEQRCKNMGLQLLSFARGKHKLKDHHGKWGWRTVFIFEFSADGHDAYQGYLEMKRLRASHFFIPPHRLPEGEEY
ncbi:DUF3301 domain-containing protein [Photobacterium leiognathi]|uniref:DUF3301 domain-containing protein n=1 Tax=Photobacterium leiognathi TaxID=553611 RepID=A0A2T3M4Z0_PHOLE|nr:DUF3301 domain-containing protein [Photobacterium leiognathi]KJF96680.1 hypothetical protein UB34_16780 [Photobacterium leiognathi]PSV86975.1 DUF3301 domain-containing protein [Photobacterium leiognathi]